MIEKINYLEYATNDPEATKAFFSLVFGWKFTDYGPDYMACEKQGLDCGFYRADKHSRADTGGALAVFESQDLNAIQDKIIEAGGVISTETFEFPGGKRFHFLEPGGNEFAVWQVNSS